MTEPLEKEIPRSLTKSVASQLVKVGLPTTGAGAVIYGFLKDDWTIAIIASVVAILISFVSIFKNFASKVIKKTEAELDKEVDDLAKWIADKIKNAALQTWGMLNASVNFKRLYYYSLVSKYRTYGTQGLKIKGPFTLDLEKVFVPLRVSPESKDKVSAAMIQKVKQCHRNLQVWDFLADNLADDGPAYRSIAVIAPPGAGKTTLLEHLTLMYAKNVWQQQYPNAPKLIPILFYLRDIRDEIIKENPPNLVQLVSLQKHVKKHNPPQNWFKNKLRAKKCLVMFDGLDEVADKTHRKKVRNWADQQIQEYPDNRFIITSRPFGYRDTPLEKVGTVLEIQLFNLKEMTEFIQNWYLQNEIMRQMRKQDEGVQETAREKSDDLIRRVRNSPPLSAMALNPLLLTMIATVHDNRGALPGRRVELYAEICDVLLGRRQEAKGIGDKLTPAQKKAILQALAYKLMTEEKRTFTLDQGCETIHEKLLDIARADEREKFIKQIENLSGLLVEREQGTYEFAHLSFQEYLAASEIKEENLENELIKLVDDPWWAETIRLYAAQSNATALVRAAVEKMTVQSLTLALDCVEEGLRVQQGVRKQLEHAFEAGLESDDKKVAKLGAEVKLNRRLQNLLRIDDNMEIDMGFITCAEYQLFIDEMKKQEEHYQPDHWTAYRFQKGDAEQPVTGVRASDAEVFCDWLTIRRSGSEIVGELDKYHYRIPSLEEVSDHPITRSEVYCWCSRGNEKIITGTNPEQWQKWQEKLQDTVRERLIADSNNAFGISLLDTTFNLNFDLNLNLNFVHNRVLAIAFDRASALDRTLASASNLGHALDSAIDSANALNSDSILDSTSSLDRDFDLIRALDLAFIHSLDYSIKSDQILFYLTIIPFRYNYLADIFGQICNNRKIIKKLKLAPQKYKTFAQQAEDARDEWLHIYAYFVLRDLHRGGKMPSWKGIRIVREKLKKFENNHIKDVPAVQPLNQEKPPVKETAAIGDKSVKVFISYAREDLEIARKLYHDLRKAGVKPWLDEEDLLPGQKWEAKIEKVIRGSLYFLAVLSSNSVTKQGVVQKEVKIALDVLKGCTPNQDFIVPVRIDECEPEYKELKERHWVDLFPSYENGFKKILSKIMG
ncbi:MAG: TIR domain-containing protein [Desulfobacterales bacterium]|nr:TIR domain-containing protein [Desulfobacterales bacterium]